MAGNDHHPDGSTGPTGLGNVVPLRPRQWLESEDELVPIAGVGKGAGDERPPTASPEQPPRANRNGSTNADSPGLDDRGHASTWLGAGEQTVPIVSAPASATRPTDDGVRKRHDPPAPWAASDFWGEDGAQLQHALEAPAQPEPEPVSRRGLRNHRLPIPPALAAVAVAAVAVIAAVIAGFGSAPAAPRASAPGSSIRASTGARTVTHATTSQPVITHAHAAHHAAISGAGDQISDGTGRRTPSRTKKPRTTNRPRHRGGVIATATAAQYVRATPASTPATTTTYTSVTPTPEASTSAPSHTGPTGPTGPISLIGSGTSPSG